MTQSRISFLVAASLSLAAGLAHAQQAGTWMVRGGVTKISPHVDSGNLTAPSLPNTQATVQSSTRPSGGVTYMVTDNVSIDLPFAAPFQHDIDGAGSISGVGKIGETKALPITLLGQYRFLQPDAQIRPYLGAGITYAKFYKERTTAAMSALTGGTPANPTTMSVDSKFGATLQAGATWRFNEHWFMDVEVLHTFLKTTAKLSTGQTLDLRLDPNTYQVAVGYSF